VRRNLYMPASRHNDNPISATSLTLEDQPMFSKCPHCDKPISKILVVTPQVIINKR